MVNYEYALDIYTHNGVKIQDTYVVLFSHKFNRICSIYYEIDLSSNGKVPLTSLTMMSPRVPAASRCGPVAFTTTTPPSSSTEKMPVRDRGSTA